MIYRLAHNIGNVDHPNYNSRQEILDCSEPIGFDGIYKNVYENRDVLVGKSGILFVMGDFVGKDNRFDLPHVPIIEQYCNWNEIYELVSNYDFKLGWHTWSHPDLTTLSKTEIMRELKSPFETDLFAYPYGRFNEFVIECVKEAGYKYAYSVTQGSRNKVDKDHNYKIYRDYI